jgi:hypothetical protein
MPQSIEMTRQQLYDLVWSRSVGALAAGIPMSHLSLKRLCLKRGEPRGQRPLQVPGVREGRGLAHPWPDVAADVRKQIRLAPMGNGPHYLPRRLILPLPFIRDLPQQIVLGPSQVGHFHDYLRSYPMHLGQLERGAETAIAGRRRGQTCRSPTMVP